MTQTLDVSERIAHPEPARRGAAATPAQTAAERSRRLETFAITFGIAYVILYTFFERWNIPLFTYHPAVDRWDLFKNTGVPEDGPPMFWYGWVVLATICATAIGAIATLVSTRWLQRATVFFCVLAALWPIFYALGLYIDEVASFNAEFLRSVWSSGVPALAGALAAATFISVERAQRIWTSWLVTLPVGGLIILGYSLREYFLR
jgi:hypothetical protein